MAPMHAQSQAAKIMAKLPKVRMAFSDLPKNRDPREVPLYSLSEAALFLGFPATTLRYWPQPHDYPRKGHVEPFILPAGMSTDMATGKDVAWLSFYNVSEAHILSAMTRFHGVKWPRVRQALDTFKDMQ